MVESMEPVGSTLLYNIHENPNTTLISGVFLCLNYKKPVIRIIDFKQIYFHSNLHCFT